MERTSTDNKYNTNATFIAINTPFIESIEALEKDNLRGKLHINEKFAGNINAPVCIPIETLGNNIRKGSKAMTKQEIEFKLRRVTKNKRISDDGKKILRSLAAILPIDTIDVDDSGNITFQDSSIKIIKPYKGSDVKFVGNDDDSSQQSVVYIKNLVEKAWDDLEQTEKGG